MAVPGHVYDAGKVAIVLIYIVPIDTGLAAEKNGPNPKSAPRD